MERVFRLRRLSEDDTILPSKVKCISSGMPPSSESWTVFISYNVKDLVLLRGLHIIN